MGSIAETISFDAPAVDARGTRPIRICVSGRPTHIIHVKEGKLKRCRVLLDRYLIEGKSLEIWSTPQSPLISLSEIGCLKETCLRVLPENSQVQ